MKISEKLSELKQKEGQLMRLFSLRDEIVRRDFESSLFKIENTSKEEIIAEEKKFLEDKKEKYRKLSNEIEQLVIEITEGKNSLNKKNVESGIDLKLAEMKFIRLELSKLMSLIKRDRYSMSKFIDADIYEELGIADRIKELEAKKAKLDNQIQHSNWSTEV